MNTLTINSKAAEVLSNAAAKCRAEKPLVKKTETYGRYLVRSGSDLSRWYAVSCDSASKEISCNCKSRKPCKHIAAVAPIHSYIAKERAAAKAAVPALEVITYCGCGGVATSREGRCEPCQAAKDRLDLGL